MAKWHVITARRFALSLIVATVASLIGARPAVAGPQAHSRTEIPLEQLRDRIRGGVIGEIFGDLNGLPHEMKYIDMPGDVKTYTPSLLDGAWTDDDTDIEWIHHFEMDTSATTLVAYPKIVRRWKTSMNKRIWTSNAYARRLMDLEIDPPLTGHIAINPNAVFNIAGEFCTESFGLVAPLMPQTASRIGLHYAAIAVDGEPLQQTQFFDTIIATAFSENHIDRLLDAGVTALDLKSELIEIVQRTRTWCSENPQDWRKTRQNIHDAYTTHRNELPDRNGYALNTAAVVAALIYGNGDYCESVRHAFNFGWDADCTAATVGTIVGTIQGGHFFDKQGWPLKDVYKNTCRDGMPNDETVTGYADRLVRIAKRVIVEQGGEEKSIAGRVFMSINTEPPGNVQRLPDPLNRLEALKTALLPELEKDLTGPPLRRARAAYLAICLDEAPRLAAARGADWNAARDELRTHQSLISALYGAPPSVAADFQERFRAAGIARPAGELLKTKL